MNYETRYQVWLLGVLFQALRAFNDENRRTYELARQITDVILQYA